MLTKKLNSKELFEGYLVQEQKESVLAMEGIGIEGGTWL